ncbi:PREDICTED: gamma-interferon-inducible lysosomal thiol reductase-like [Papilio xuthus]|uniref:Gamma-interferon-inducible lysosomal thiol reductase-like n=1 Tax=Papilio xuthus TaxID=66420 RepID=A0AAJ6ZQ89_PAPXU|nr:PREDICTED: gamma-interferon-inducible lysosomal thiol reductase-like [Papilio xuthus]
MFIFIILLFLGQQIVGSLDVIKPSESLLQYNKLLHLKSYRRSSLTSQPLETVYVVVYYESLCEDSRDFFTTQLTAAYELLEPYLDVRLIPYGKATTKVVDSPEYYTFRCHHGPLECHGNKLHACALNIFPSEKNALVFNSCLMDYDHTGQGSDDIAADKCGRALALNVKSIKQCASNDTGTFLHNYYGQRTRMTKFSYVPHILINGVRSNGTNLIADICAILKSPPTGCKIFKP